MDVLYESIQAIQETESCIVEKVILPLTVDKTRAKQ